MASIQRVVSPLTKEVSYRVQVRVNGRPSESATASPWARSPPIGSPRRAMHWRAARSPAASRARMRKRRPPEGIPALRATVNRDLATLSHLLSMAKREWRLIGSNAVEDISRKKRAGGAYARDCYRCAPGRAHQPQVGRCRSDDPIRDRETVEEELDNAFCFHAKRLMGGFL